MSSSIRLENLSVAVKQCAMAGRATSLFVRIIGFHMKTFFTVTTSSRRSDPPEEPLASMESCCPKTSGKLPPLGAPWFAPGRSRNFAFTPTINPSTIFWRNRLNNYGHHPNHLWRTHSCVPCSHSCEHCDQGPGIHTDVN